MSKNKEQQTEIKIHCLQGMRIAGNITIGVI